jgi:hypothetical protein
MSLITISENRVLNEYRKNWYLNLVYEKYLVENHFDWLKLIITEDKIKGQGNLYVGHNKYYIELWFSPFFNFRFDRIYIKDKTIKYNNDIHLYIDMSLCLYHPVLDKPFLKTIPLYKMIPWISEWCIFYEGWKKYGVWLGKEIKHRTTSNDMKS